MPALEPESGRTRLEGRGLVLAALALVLAVLAAFGGVRHNGFVEFDDPDYVARSPIVAEGLTARGLAWAFEDAHYANWHPLTWISHMIDVELFGLDAGAHHMVSVVLHAASAVLLLLALVALGVRRAPALVTAALFALHPLRVESVAWASERKDTLSGLFWMLALLAYARYARRPGWRGHVLVALALVAGLLSKSIVVTLPFVFLLLDVWPLARWREGAVRLVLEKLPWIALALAAAAVTVLTQRGAGAMDADLPLDRRLANVPTAYLTYLRKLVWPSDLAVYYPHPALLARDAGGLYARGALAALALAAVTAALLGPLRRRPHLAVGWLWFLGVSFPVVGVVQVGTQPFADRYTYLALIGPVLALAVEVDERVRGRAGASRAAALLAALALLACVVLTRAQVATWRDTESLFAHAARVTEGNYVALGHLGVVAESRAEVERAEQLYLEALAAQPTYAVALNNLGVLLAKRGDLPGARARFEAAVRANPRHADSWANLGAWHLEMSDPAAAIAPLERALEVTPGHAGALANLERARRALEDG